MKSVLSLAILAFMPLAQAGEEFKNWYFEFFLGDVTMTGEMLARDGTPIEGLTGKISSSLDQKTGIVSSKSVISFTSRDHKVTGNSTMKHHEKKTYTGKGSNSNGGRYESSMELQDGKRYVSTIQGDDGLTVVIEGTLQKDGTVVTKEVVQSAEGKEIVTIKAIYRRAPKKEEAKE